MLEGVSYSVHMDLEGFRDLFRAQQIRYTRKLGILCAVLFGFMTIASVFACLSAPSVEMVGGALLFVALLVFGVVMAVRPPLMLATRAGVVRRWFAQRGAAGTGDDQLGQLVADYTVTLSAFGFTEASLAYNLMGINWAFRNEDASGVLFLPRELVEKNPGLVDETSFAIKDARRRYLGRGKRPIEDKQLASWLAAK